MEPPPEDDQRPKRKRPWDPGDDDPGAIPGSSRAADEQQSQDRSNRCMDDAASEFKHRIFLSHSGHDKDFVEELCGDLEKWYRFPFFDKRPSSLPRGESFPELILDAAHNCQMGVVVVSDEYFMSKWPMIELDAFVQTWLMQKEQNTETKLKILPLFYGLSVLEFGKEERRAKWFSKWEDLAKEDPRVDIDRWKRSVRVLASFNGIVYRGGIGEKAYREEIVELICNDVPPDVKWDDSHVQGGSKICQVIEEAISQIQPSQQYGVRVVGVYGVGGLGKTTLCKTLGNRLFQKKHMKGSHVELGSKGYGELLKQVLKDCTNTNQVFVQGLDEGKCRDILLKEACKQKVFLAIDNVWPNSKSLEDVKKFLQLGFHKESIVLVTSRALGTLTSLGISKCDCFEMPCLDDVDARNLFLYHAAYGMQFSNENDRQAIESCVRLCYFRKGTWKDGHYLPLALKALGIQLGCSGNSPLEWVKTLPKVRNFNYLEEEENPVFNILRSSFDRLRLVEQNLLLDMVVFNPAESDGDLVIGLMEWLALVHNQSLHEIETMVQQLKNRGLVEAIDLATQEVYIHVLYRKFAILEAEGKLKDLAFEERKWVSCFGICPTDLLVQCGRLKNLTRVRIVGSKYYCGRESCNWIEKIEWANCSNIVVLTLKGLHGSLDLKGLRCVRSLYLIDVYPLDGFQDLPNLNYFLWHGHLPDDYSRIFIQTFPPSLKVLLLNVSISLSSNAFDMCVNLTTLKLENCSVGYLDFENCSSLQSVDIRGLLPDFEVDSDLGIRGLQDLPHLTYLSWRHNLCLKDDEPWNEELKKNRDDEEYHKWMDCQLPMSIEVLKIYETVFLRPDVFDRCTKLSKLKLRYCRVEDLQLRSCKSLQSLEIFGLLHLEQPYTTMVDESLCNLQDMKSLTHLTLVPFYIHEEATYKLDQLPASLEVLEIHARMLLGLSVFDGCVNLTKLILNEVLEDYEDIDDDYGRPYYKMGPLPPSLKVLETNVRMLLEPNAFDQCVNLTKLDMRNCWIESPDFSNCTSLQSLKLWNLCPELEAMSDWGLCGLQNLRNLIAFNLEFAEYACNDLCYRIDQLPTSLHVIEIKRNILLPSGVIEGCVNLTKLDLWNCWIESPNFSNCSSLQSLKLQDICLDLEVVSDWSLCGLQNLSNLIELSLGFNDNVRKDFYYRIDELPTSLHVVEIKRNVLLTTGVIERCVNLTGLNIWTFNIESLHFGNFSSLKYLSLHGPHPSNVKDVSDWNLWGLQELNNLTYFRWGEADNHDKFYYTMGQLPMSLTFLGIFKKVLLRSDVVARCTKLEQLILDNCCAETKDLSYFTSLRWITLRRIAWLQSISGLSAASTSLRHLKVDGCDNLVGIPELFDLVSLEELHLQNLGYLWNLRLSDLSGLTKLTKLYLGGSNVELREEDMCMLASLPQLNLIDISDSDHVYLQIDVVRRKLVKFIDVVNYKKEEKDLDMLPIWI